MLQPQCSAVVTRLTKRGGSAMQSSMDVPATCAGTKPQSFHLFLNREVTKAVGIEEDESLPHRARQIIPAMLAQH